MDYQVIDQLRPGDTVKVLGIEGDWVKVTVPELTGYVHKNYLNILIGACGAGGAFFYLKNKKSQAESAERPDPDADYREDDDGYDIPEESEEDEAEDLDDEEE